MKNIVILGSTGSIGKNSLEVISRYPDRYRASYLVAHRNIDLLRQQIERFHPEAVAVIDECAASVLKKLMNGTIEVFAGSESVEELVRRDDIDVVISSLVGFAGLRPTIQAIEAGKTIALANKETLVVAGELIMKLAGEKNVSIIPVDSEHSAILQCLLGEDRGTIAKVILTASGGPFLNTPLDKLKTVTVDEALNHPNWRMGNKITIDSATLMNKGLEVIEAHHLFGLSPDKIEVVIHPQSIIHSMVEFIDGSVKAQLGVPDMKIPIQYALTYPQRANSNFERVDFAKTGTMEFQTPDLEQFPCLRLAIEAMHEGGTMPTVLNAANEIAVEAFLNKEISFMQIPDCIEQVMNRHTTGENPSLHIIEETDREARAQTRSYIESFD
jgi:1-deoxy-D-xylulose-5-phosphate reductoisomerase